jgi:hypothetical protein
MNLRRRFVQIPTMRGGSPVSRFLYQAAEFAKREIELFSLTLDKSPAAYS